MRTLTLLLLLMIMLCGIGRAQTITANQNLQGKWTVNLDKTLRAISGEEKEKYNSMTAGARESIQKTFRGRTYSFTEGGQAMIDFAAPNGQRHITGIWTYNTKSRILGITAEQRSKEYVVRWTDANNIILVEKDSASPNIVKEIHLIRQR